MIAVALVPIVVIGLVILVVVAVIQQRATPSETASALLRTYLYVASLVGVVTLAFGLVALVDAIAAVLFGTTFVYGGPVTTSANATETRPAEDAVRGITFAAFGASFWFVHWLARRRVLNGDQGSQYRGYVLVGAAAFGISTIVFLPTGVYQALSNWLVARPAGSYYQPVAEPLVSGLVSLALWLLYLRAALRKTVS
jgi:hypothetical protein